MGKSCDDTDYLDKRDKLTKESKDFFDEIIRESKESEE